MPLDDVITIEEFAVKMIEHKIPPFITEKFLYDYLMEFNETNRPEREWMIILDVWMSLAKKFLQAEVLKHFDSTIKH